MQSGRTGVTCAYYNRQDKAIVSRSIQNEGRVMKLPYIPKPKIRKNGT